MCRASVSASVTESAVGVKWCAARRKAAQQKEGPMPEDTEGGRPDNVGATPAAEGEAVDAGADPVVQDVLVEEVSIDGMCGVY